MKFILCFIGSLLMFAGACSLFSPGGVMPVKVEGFAMAPALRDGDRIFIDRRFEKLAQGDIVIFYYPEDQRKSYIKRIIGMPNDKVEIRGGKVLVNGNELQESYVDPKNNLSSRSQQEKLVPPDNFYVMGDNRDNSSDSRSWGTVPRKLIYGKFVRKYSAAE